MTEPMGEPRGTSPRIGEWMSTAFNLFSKEWQVWLVHGFLALLVPVLLGGGVAAAGFALGIAAVFQRPAGDPQATLFLAGAIVLTLIAIVAPSLYFGAGMIRTAARQLRGEPVGYGDLKVPLGRVLRLGGAFLIVAPLQILGFLLCVAPAVLVTALFLYVPPLIVDRGLGVGAALATSVRLTRPHLWMNALWALLIILINMAGGAIVVGHVATLPISMLMLVVGYHAALSPLAAVEAEASPYYRQP